MYNFMKILYYIFILHLSGKKLNKLCVKYIIIL
jgi:hypothetical protein